MHLLGKLKASHYCFLTKTEIFGPVIHLYEVLYGLRTLLFRAFPLASHHPIRPN